MYICMCVFNLTNLSTAQGFAYFNTQLGTAATKINGQHQVYLTNNVILIINTGATLIVLPLINHIIIPFWPTINMRFKLGVGFALHVLSFGVAGFIQWSETTEGVLTDQQFFYWMLLPTVLLSTAEAIVFVSGGFNIDSLMMHISGVARWGACAPILCMCSTIVLLFTYSQSEYACFTTLSQPVM